MPKIFITGISGTGKTTIAKALNSRGMHAISIDEVPGLCSWKEKASGKEVDYEAELNSAFINSHNWICDEEKLRKLFDESTKTIMVLGMAANQDEFLNLFDKVLLLQCKPETFIKRIQERKDNDFGKEKSAQEFLLDSYKQFENGLLEKGALPIDTEGSVDSVVENILEQVKLEFLKNNQ